MMAGRVTDRERWRRIEEILDEALELPPEETPAFLDDACAGDPELRAEVEALLAADEKAGRFLETPAQEYARFLLDPSAEADPETLPPPRLVGRQLGPYRVIRRIAAGGMGEVYEARDDRLQRRVALKLLPGAWQPDRAAKERFLREARAASTLDHPNICTVHDVGETDDGQLFMVMAYYQGESLESKLKRGPLAVDEARGIAVQVARGLERAHQAGIIHRDVKPANLIVTDRGEGRADRAKILDFGIAKIAGEVGLTRTGTSPGTPAYMAPERAHGGPADARSDLWSLGVVLYQMLAGRRPFPGDAPQAVMYSICTKEPEPLARVCPEVPADLARTVAKAMAKDPADRYQSAAEMLADLETPTAPTAITAATARRRRFRLAAAGLAVGVLAIAGWWALQPGDQRPAPAPSRVETEAVAPARHSLAVLYFRNLTGDSELDWLTEMLVTDLRQSPEIDVLSPSRLYQILHNLDALGQPNPSAELIRMIAEQGDVEMVVRCSYARAGELLRITFTIEDAASGKILKDQTVQNRGEESLFAMVDEVGAAIRNHFAIVRPSGSPEKLEMVTTSSLEAWRLYSEGVALFRQSKFSEAAVLLEKAVEIDSSFALALVNLGRMHHNLGHHALAHEYTRRAFEQADRLPLDRRFSVETAYYGNRWATYSRAIDKYREAALLYPDREVFRSGLGVLYASLEQYDEASEQYEVLIRRGAPKAEVAGAAAIVHTALGRFDTGNRLLGELASRQPDNWLPRMHLAWHLVHWDRLEAAAERLRQAAKLRPGEYFVHYTAWRLQVLREDWERADLEAAKMAAMSDSHFRWRGAVSQARNLVYRGRSEEALGRLADAARVYTDPEAHTALARCWAAELLLARGEADRALTEARIAQKEGRDHWPELQGLFLEAVAEEELGRPEAADAIEKTLRMRWQAYPNRVEERQLYHLRGRRALARGEAAAAVEALRQAQALLSPRGVEIHAYTMPDHVPVWFALGTAELAAGDPEAALEWFRRVAESGAEHIEFPVPWARSFYFLGRIHQQRGETAAARRSFERFLGLWRHGDLDRDQVGEALEVAIRSRGAQSSMGSTGGGKSTSDKALQIFRSSPFKR